MVNSTNKLCPIILAGGGGTRLWPLSRELYPKQFLSIFSEHSMLQTTLLRLQDLQHKLNMESALLITNQEHRFLVAEQLRTIDASYSKIILEPVGRNTAPALTIAALTLQATDPILLMMPSDHHIVDTVAFQQAIKLAYAKAQDDYLITFGCVPTHAETGYGYIQYEPDSSTDQDHFFKLLNFVEKPNAPTAKQYLEQGDYLWNSGMFMVKASLWCDYVKQLQPDIYNHCEATLKDVKTKELKTEEPFLYLNDQFKDCPSDSVDYAIMEKLSQKNIALLGVVKLDVGWSDIGSWSAVWQKKPKDNNNNVMIGDVRSYNTTGSMLSASDHLLVALGCKNIIAVHTKDATLICDYDHVQDIKQVVQQLKKDNRIEANVNTKVYRPWGYFESVDEGVNYQVKRLSVKPKHKLSLQSHQHRSEHWVVVHGEATVTCDDKELVLKPDQSTYIPIGCKHRLANETDDILEVIEVQTGSYLGEDDIVRYDDDFDRC